MVKRGIYITTGKRAEKYHEEISDAIDMVQELIKINDELGFATTKGWI
jgi:phage terminase small subunit